MINQLKLGIGILAVTLWAPQASSESLTGTLGLGGILDPYCTVAATTCELDAADALDFGANGFGTDGLFIVTIATGDFASLSFGDVGSISDFQFNPLTPDPVATLWSIQQFRFSLDSVSIVNQESTSLLLMGSGFLRAEGFDNTPGIWTLSADIASGVLNFSYSSTVQPVPVPGALLLFGSGLAMLGRRRQS